MAPSLIEDTWRGEDVSIAEIERELARLRDATAAEDSQPNLRTSVMTHIAWVPEEWVDAAEATLMGMAERHPSRTLLLVPRPGKKDRLDATLSIRCFPVGDRAICSEVIELELRGERAAAPASIVLPLLISDLPVFCRWRGEPDFASQQFEQMVGIVDRLIVNSTEWPNLPGAYAELAGLFDKCVVSDIAWARTERWRTLLASLWPSIADVKRIRVQGTPAQAYLLGGWLSSRLDHRVEVEVEERDTIEGIDLDGKQAPFPPGDPPNPSDVLSAELDSFTRDRIYEAAALAAAS
ncbi:MAG TPA: glucose-6-phosphate dehydrogenase assembly protein OpcA [Gaiellaceae bacterium]|jgi:glucose-6-phosphate dehydrogenase assembly protein OpcA